MCPWEWDEAHGALGMLWSDSELLILLARQARLLWWIKLFIPYFLHNTWGFPFIFSTSRVFSVCLTSCLPHFFCLNSHSFFSPGEFHVSSAQPGQVLLLPLAASFPLLFSQANLQSGSLVKNIHVPKRRFLIDALIWGHSDRHLKFLIPVQSHKIFPRLGFSKGQVRNHLEGEKHL